MGINVTHSNLKNFSYASYGSVNFPYPCENYSECSPYSVVLDPGFYLLEVWGAEGGDNGSSLSGPGGYSHGTLRLSSTTKAYVRVGGKGDIVTKESFSIPGGYNGGGSSENAYDSEFSSGGGASDIRINEDDDMSRVIVAGGGGGYGIYFRNDLYIVNKGGFGGGLNGGDGEDGYRDSHFGRGGGIEYSIYMCNASYCYSGGGGGWSNGGTGIRYGSSAGGGSGFVFDAHSILPDDYKLDNKYHLRDAKTLTNQSGFLSPNSIFEFGHRGNGYARITILNPFLTCAKKSRYNISSFLYMILLSHHK